MLENLIKDHEKKEDSKWNWGEIGAYSFFTIFIVGVIILLVIQAVLAVQWIRGRIIRAREREERNKEYLQRREMRASLK